jgi:tetratricopeptide (TPR) repeat protein
MNSKKNKNMKKIRNILLFLAVSAFLSACFELDQVDPNQQNEDSYWNTKEHFYKGIIAAYDVLQQGGWYHADIHIIFTGMSDEGTNEWPYEFNLLCRFIQSPSDDVISSTWPQAYAMISRCYQVIENSDRVNHADVDVNVGEAKFLISLAYYNMVHLFGERIAYVDRVQSAADRARRAEEGEVYDLMESLLEEAVEVLPEIYDLDQLGRATRGAAQALLAKVYLARNKYAEAEPILRAILESGTYNLLENFEDNFNEYPGLNPESIFQVNWVHESADIQPDYLWRVPMFTLIEDFGGFGDMQATNYALEQFEEEDGDVRKDLSVFYPGTSREWWNHSYDEWAWEEDEEGNLVSRLGNPDKVVGIYKYSEQVKVGENDYLDIIADAGSDFIVIRYADVLLLYAETLNQNGKTGEAYQYVDEIRERAGLPPLSTNNPGLSQADFHEQIKHERFVELFGENIRFFDLKRWGMWGPELAANDDNFDGFVVGKSEFAPIPQRALDLNENLVQNPGY